MIKELVELKIDSVVCFKGNDMKNLRLVQLVDMEGVKCQKKK